MSVRAIVPDGRGGIPCGYRAPIITYSRANGANWDTANVTYYYFLLTPEEEYLAWDGLYQPFSKTSKVFRFYVDSVSGATEGSDTGDGSQSNPYTCLNSVLHALQPDIHSAYSVSKRHKKAAALGCFCGETIVQIVITGVVNYSLSYFPTWIDRLIITGNGDTEFDLRNVNAMPVLAGDVNIQNCTIRESGNAAIRGYRTVFDNCEVHSPRGANGYTLLYNSQFYAAVGASSVQLGYLYGSGVYLENGVGDGVSFDIHAVNACQNLIRFTAKSSFSYGDIIGSTITSYSYNSTCMFDGDIINSSITHTEYMDTYDDDFSMVIGYLGNVYNSSIAANAIIQADDHGVLPHYPVFLILDTSSRIIEDSQITFNVSHDANPDYDEHSYESLNAYVFADVANSAFKNAVIRGSLSSPALLPVQYRYRLCWAADKGSDFVAVGGSAFSRIEHVSDPSLSWPCPVDPY